MFYRRTPLPDQVLNCLFLVFVTDFININLLDIYSCYLPNNKSEKVMIVKKESNGSVRQLCYTIAGSQGDTLRNFDQF